MRPATSIAFLLLLIAAALIAGCRKSQEPDRVEYTKPDGSKTSDVKSVGDGALSYQVLGGPSIPAKATELHREARTKGESGDYAAALDLLRQASRIAPEWPYPYYDMAFTYLLQGDSTDALSNYRETDRLEPGGFFTTKTAIWTLDREEKGIFPKGTYLAFVSLEWAEPEKKRAIVDRMTTAVPEFAPAWKEKALLLEDNEQRLATFEKALSLQPDPETYGLCVLNKAALLNNLGKAAAARQIVEELIRSDTSTLGTKALAKETLKTFTK